MTTTLIHGSFRPLGLRRAGMVAATLSCALVWATATQADDLNVSLASAFAWPDAEQDAGVTPTACCTMGESSAAASCDSGTCSPSCCCRCGLLGGLVEPTSCCYDSFISPITNPTFFEDPRTLTEARLIFLNHKLPLAAGSGDVQLYAVQLRAALADRLSLIASRSGYIVSQNPLIEDGWADITVGLKYNLISDPCSQTVVSGVVTYEMAIGSQRALQGNGDGTFNLLLTGGTELTSRSHWISATGIILPTDDNAESTWGFWSNHFDYCLGHGVYALTEFNWYHYLESGAGGLPGIEGGDLFNLGSTGVAGNDIVTGAFGLKYKPSRKTEIGLAWELPLTERRDVLENRLTFDWILRY